MKNTISNLLLRLTLLAIATTITGCAATPIIVRIPLEGINEYGIAEDSYELRYEELKKDYLQACQDWDRYIHESVIQRNRSKFAPGTPDSEIILTMCRQDGWDCSTPKPDKELQDLVDALQYPQPSCLTHSS